MAMAGGPNLRRLTPPTRLRRPPSAPQVARTRPRVKRATDCQYVTPSQRAPEPDDSTAGSVTSTRCLDSKPPDSSTRSLVSQSRSECLVISGQRVDKPVNYP